MAQRQAEADRDRREACRRLRGCCAEDDAQERGGQDHFDQRSRRHPIAARRQLAEPVRCEAAGRPFRRCRGDGEQQQRGKPAARTAVPRSPKTSQKVPRASAVSFLIIGIFSFFRRCLCTRDQHGATQRTRHGGNRRSAADMAALRRGNGTTKASTPSLTSYRFR